MVEFTLLVIGSYLISAVLVHAVYHWFPRLREPSRHYVLVTRNNEQQAEYALRAITWLSKLRGIYTRITVVDESSEDQTIPIIERLDRDGSMGVVRSRNWLETEVWLNHMKQQVRTACDRDERNDWSAEDRHRSSGDRREKITVIYMNRLDDRLTTLLLDL